MTGDLLEVRDLEKRFGAVTAVDGVSFSVPAGVCFGLLGPNGAGKTTTIEIIEGILAPSSGQIAFLGQPRDGGFREQVGVQFQETALLDFLTVRETLATFARLYRRPSAVDELIALCRLEEIAGRDHSRLSGGQKQRLLLALALVNDPRLLILDEPSTGLDPQARRDLWRIIETIKSQGRTVILTTHYMEEAERLCSDIAIMDRGRIIARGSPAELVRRHCGGVAVHLPSAQWEALTDKPPLTVRRLADTVVLEGDSTEQVLELLLARGMTLTDLRIETPNLETVFLNLTGRRLHQEAS